MNKFFRYIIQFTLLIFLIGCEENPETSKNSNDDQKIKLVNIYDTCLKISDIGNYSNGENFDGIK